MLNLKKNLFVAGTLALCALTACSSDNPSSAGSTTIPNANTDPSGSTQNTEIAQIVFMTAATSVDSLQGGELKAFEKENGASASCSADGKTYSSEIQIDKNNMVVTHLKLENTGNLCEGILIRFNESCGTDVVSWAKCDDKGNLEVFCGDHRMTNFTKCTATNPPSCTTKEADTTITFGMLVSDFSASASDICNKISEGAESSYGRFVTPTSTSISDNSSSSIEAESSSSEKTTPQLIDEYGNPVTEIDTAKFTLDNYTAQFTDEASELMFDSHVLAYNGSSAYSLDFHDSAPTIKEITTDKVAEYFPLTAAVAGEKINPDNCKLYIVVVNDGGQPTGHVLGKASEGSVEVYGVHPGGRCMISQAMLTVSFLVQDCDGLIDENATISHKSFTSNTWACEEGKYSPTKKAVAYGEWYRADLRE